MRRLMVCFVGLITVAIGWSFVSCKRKAVEPTHTETTSLSEKSTYFVPAEQKTTELLKTDLTLYLSTYSVVPAEQRMAELLKTDPSLYFTKKFSSAGDLETKCNVMKELIVEFDVPEKRKQIASALFMINRQRGLPILRKTLLDNDWKVRMNSARAIYYYIGDIVKYKDANDKLVEFKPNAWDEKEHWPRFYEEKIDGKVYLIDIAYGIGATTRIYKIVDAELAFKAVKKKLLDYVHREDKSWAATHLGIPNILKIMEAASLQNKERITYLEYQNAILSKKDPETIKKASDDWNKAKKEYETFLENSWYAD